MAAGSLALSVCLFLLFLGRHAAAAATGEAEAKYYPAGQCVSSCDAEHKCLSDACVERWDDCLHGFDKVPGLDMVQMSKEVEFDESDCYDNGCAFGGCDKTGYAEFSKESCSNIIDAFCIFCYREKCCRLREWVRCCPKLDCIKELAGCPTVPQQEASHTWASSIYYTKLADGGSVVFPFYRVSEVPEGGDCESERLLGACSCADGAKLPGGCDPKDSSTWAVWNGTAASGDSLPAGLSLTCALKPPPPAATIPNPAADAGADAGSEGQPASADVPQEAPDAGEEGGGPGDVEGASPAEPVDADTHSNEAGTHSDDGTGTPTPQEKNDAGAEKERGKGGPTSAYTGAIVAASIISALTTAAIVAGIAVAYKRRLRRKSHVRTTEAYEAMLTGTSYTPPMKAKAPLMSTVRRAFQQVLGHKQPDFQPTLENLEDGSALQEPAAPADDEIFTVQDLAQTVGNQRAKKWHKGNVNTLDKEMEMQEQAHLLQQSPAKISKPDITTHELSLQSREEGEPAGNLVEGPDEGERPRTPPPTGGGQKRVVPDAYHRD